MKVIKLRGLLDSECHANDFVFSTLTLNGEDLEELLKDYEGVVVSIIVKPLLSICPKCGSRMRHVSNMWLCPKGDFSYYEDEDGKVGRI